MSDTPMTFMEHLVELRRRFTRAAAYVLVASFITWEWKEVIFQFLSAPIREGLAQYGIYSFRAIEIGETLFVYIKATLVAAIVFTIPLVLYELWGFVAPGLYEKEKQAVAPVIFFSTLFFLLGVFFAYKVVIPFMASYLAEVTVESGSIAMDVTVKSAFDFALIFLLGFGVSFELPMIMFFLSTLGLVTAKTYVRVFRYFIIVSFIVAGILTPPDPISQTLLALPLNILYWVGVAGAFVVERKGTVGLFRFRARVWGFLSLSLLLLGGVLFGATTWFGRSTSLLRLVPGDATWVVSVRLGSLSDSSAVQNTELLARLGIPDGVVPADHVVVVGLADGQTVALVADGCSDPLPADAKCDRDDLLLGPASAIDALLNAESALEKDPTLTRLNESAPAFLWHRKPPRSVLAWLPGVHDQDLALGSLTGLMDLRGQAPWVEAGVSPMDVTRLATLGNRTDIWRREREREQAVPPGGASSEGHLLRLMDALLSLSSERFRLVAGNNPRPVDPAMTARLDALAKDETRVRAELTQRQKELNGPSPTTPSGASLVERLGPTSVARWMTRVEDGEIRLRVEVTPSAGIRRLLTILPKAAVLSTP